MTWMGEGKSVGLRCVLGGCRELTHEGRWASKSGLSWEGRDTSLSHLPPEASKLD